MYCVLPRILCFCELGYQFQKFNSAKFMRIFYANYTYLNLHDMYINHSVQMNVKEFLFSYVLKLVTYLLLAIFKPLKAFV